MKWWLILLVAIFTTASQAQHDTYPNDTFVIPNLVTTTYITNRRLGQRAHHMWFTLIDNSYHWEPKNTTCNVKWRSSEPAPSTPINCKDSFMVFSVQNFTDIKDFTLEVGHIYGSNCPACCDSSDQFLPRAAMGQANITRDGLKWRHTRTTSGSTVSAVADEAVIMPIHYMKMCDDHIDDDDGSTSEDFQDRRARLSLGR